MLLFHVQLTAITLKCTWWNNTYAIWQ